MSERMNEVSSVWKVAWVVEAVRIYFAVAILAMIPVSVRADLVFSAAGAGPVANLYAVDSAGDLRRITDNIRWRDIDADIAGDGRVVFSSNRETEPKIDVERRSEHFHLYLTDIHGRPPVPLTAGNSDERMPRFSPDGRSVAFIRHAPGVQQLVMIELGGEEQVIFSAEEIFDFSWSPGGENLVLALRNGAESAVALKAVSGSHEDVNTVARGAGDDWLVAARWSPDGRRIALIRHPLRLGERSLSVLDLANGDERRLSPAGVEVQQSVDWSDDGERLLYAALVDYNYRYDEAAHKKIHEGAMHIFQSSIDGETRRLSAGGGLHRAPVFSPDEKRIAFLYAPSLDARRLALRTMRVDGEGVRELYPAVTRHSGILWR
ncbi:LpqB family beta-propeller domain-containing protein [Microbulbifer thermotolerans]|uniref:TolB family protein n=1 Tax=Microbulbifer thermotolerans TaxID=252514 RepID=UPI0022491ACF|nr:LpqB family beta-propeller domain-containing protein [Microbulbifer thermotolerans]MCX2795397.1 LpqB family beta-propeller domain-containing protein [Microbulbifer thermotolerans]